MAEQTAIEWCDATFNPWWGCSKVSPACAHCYAETWAYRTGHHVWGSEAPRRFFGDEHWREPERWDRDAAQAGQPRYVFCGSMCDILEDREDLVAQRVRLWELIERTPHLIWLLLTKRPERYRDSVPKRWLAGAWPRNAWAGTTTENQEQADRRILHLLPLPAPVRFLSAEPLLGPLMLGLRPHRLARDAQRIDWVITGGETGAGARPSRLDWFRELRDECVRAGIAFFFKQHGDWMVSGQMTDQQMTNLIARTKGQPTMLPNPDFARDGHFYRIGKPHAGRVLDGKEWNERP